MRKATLNELMGKSGGTGKERKLTLADLPDILGERMPKIEYSPVGRMRLTAALRVRFGDNYRHLPGIENILHEFDKEARFNVKLQEMKMLGKGKK